MKTRNILLLLFCFVIQIKSQTVTNIDLFYNQIDSVVIKIKRELSGVEKIKLEFISPADLSYLKSHVFYSFAKNKIISDTANDAVEFKIDKASVRYENLEKENFLGEFIADRFIEVSGSYLIKKNSDIVFSHDIHEEYSDKVSASDIKELENNSLPFTQGKFPAEPFFNSLYEPIIAVSAIAISVYLFFSVRSK
ncbi:MAG: hypothetical protein Fur0015_08240 [Ignavibacteriales bacterium]